jgi:diacylglycerol kinase family enzyme
MNDKIGVIATTISGSIKDWGKIPKIVPLFKENGLNNVNLFSVASHTDARQKATELVKEGCDIIISAGGSGTFNAVVEGCCDAGERLDLLRIGFLRKGSADLIGKALGMSDDIEEAIRVFVNSIKHDYYIHCDILKAIDKGGKSINRRFVGYGGAEIFGGVPYYTENRFIKYYKGLLSQLFGDMGPFFVGMCLSTINKLLSGKKKRWEIKVNGEIVDQGKFQALIIVNGDLGPNLPFAQNKPLGSGEFYLFTLRDLGLLKLLPQTKHAWDGSVLDNPERWGFKSHIIKESLEIIACDGLVFPLNTDGSTMICKGAVQIKIVDQIKLISAQPQKMMQTGN